MTIPQFTAEASLYQLETYYKFTKEVNNNERSIFPQLSMGRTFPIWPPIFSGCGLWCDDMGICRYYCT